MLGPLFRQQQTTLQHVFGIIQIGWCVPDPGIFCPLTGNQSSYSGGQLSSGYSGGYSSQGNMGGYSDYSEYQLSDNGVLLNTTWRRTFPVPEHIYWVHLSIHLHPSEPFRTKCVCLLELLGPIVCILFLLLGNQGGMGSSYYGGGGGGGGSRGSMNGISGGWGM